MQCHFDRKLIPKNLPTPILSGAVRGLYYRRRKFIHLMQTIAIVGSSGYIGKHLVADLVSLRCGRIKVLARRAKRDSVNSSWPNEVEVVQGDLHDTQSLLELFEPGCIVVNLVYLWNSGERVNLAITENLLAACKISQVRRLIHCSTAAVVGRVPDDDILESTSCKPITEYGVTKLKIERLIIDAANGSFDAAIVRPTGVFGPGGEPLRKLANDLIFGNRVRNYLKSSLFGKRRMNLVHITNVVAAVRFFIQYLGDLDGGIFIVSDDRSSSNNFADIENTLMRSLGCSRYIFPRIPLPMGLLALLLWALRRNNINPRCNYSQGKLDDLGFRSPVTFEDGLKEYADWYQSTRVSAPGRASK